MPGRLQCVFLVTAIRVDIINIINLFFPFVTEAVVPIIAVTLIDRIVHAQTIIGVIDILVPLTTVHNASGHVGKVRIVVTRTARITNIANTITISISLIGIGGSDTIIHIVSDRIIIGVRPDSIVITNIADTITIGVSLVSIGDCNTIINNIIDPVIIQIRVRHANFDGDRTGHTTRGIINNQNVRFNRSGFTTVNCSITDIVIGTGQSKHRQQNQQKSGKQNHNPFHRHLLFHQPRDLFIALGSGRS